MSRDSKIAFVTNACLHYRVGLFELLAQHCPLDFYFFSQPPAQKVRFAYRFLPGIGVGKLRLSLTLIWCLWAGDYEMIIKCLNGRLPLVVAYLIARWRRKPFILWMGIWMRLQSRTHRLIFPLTRHIYRRADAIVVYGDHVKQYLISEGIAPEKIFIAAQAVDNALYQREVSPEEQQRLRPKHPFPADHRIILYVGRLVPEKGLPDLLAAFAQVRDQNTTLLLVGTGTEQAALQQLAEKLGIGLRVCFAGEAVPEATVAYYSTAYALVLPSITTSLIKEPWGLVVNEAFNQGVPVIATSAVGAGAGGLICDGINGYIVPEYAPAVIAARLNQLLDEPGLRSKMGQQAREKIAAWDYAYMMQGFTQAIHFVREQAGTIPAQL